MWSCSPHETCRPHQPDFTPLIGASQTAGKHMKRGTTIVFESTVTAPGRWSALPISTAA